ncbi:MAG TPA: hypothetical protein VMI06_02290 [Terriglobia bacterium]|nr:hypothetical protein [Terriglobia bacterium]
MPTIQNRSAFAMIMPNPDKPIVNKASVDVPRRPTLLRFGIGIVVLGPRSAVIDPTFQAKNRWARIFVYAQRMSKLIDFYGSPCHRADDDHLHCYPVTRQDDGSLLWHLSGECSEVLIAALRRLREKLSQWGANQEYRRLEAEVRRAEAIVRRNRTAIFEAAMTQETHGMAQSTAETDLKLCWLAFLMSHASSGEPVGRSMMISPINPFRHV